MWRGLLFFIKLAVLVAVAVWVAERPGMVSIEWLGYRVETTTGILLLVLVVLMVVIALLYRGWRALLGAPRNIGRSLADGRRRRGYKALSHGMVAVAAGDAREARRWARKAVDLLDEPPLTRLLAAQAAQLDGDEQAARRYFLEMLDSEETQFLGLRGLVTQALRDGDEATARRYLQQAYALRPETPWVLENLFALSEKQGDLDAAEDILLEGLRHQALPRPETLRKRSVVLLEKAQKNHAEGNFDKAIEQAREAVRFAPEFVPAALLLADLYARSDRRRKARKLLEQAWRFQPHPEVAQAYLKLFEQESPLDRIKRLEGLVEGQREHRESRIALARATLEAGLWGEARRHLELAGGEQPERRVCHLRAELEDREHGNTALAAEWLRRAETAAPDPAWICSDCGAAADAWTPRCRACDAFDSLSWRTPPQVHVALSGERAQTGGGTLIVADAAHASTDKSEGTAAVRAG